MLLLLLFDCQIGCACFSRSLFSFSLFLPTYNKHQIHRAASLLFSFFLSFFSMTMMMNQHRKCENTLKRKENNEVYSTCSAFTFNIFYTIVLASSLLIVALRWKEKKKSDGSHTSENASEERP
jgi:cellulose synthase/poly-beta-1,6-N-acetylglucosamine synthase-like glycosyltransferase